MGRYFGWIVVAALSYCAPSVNGQVDQNTFSVVAWNVEAGGSEMPNNFKVLKSLEPFDIMALNEVPQESTGEAASRWSKGSSIVGETGGDNRLVIAWNDKKFDKVEAYELKQVDGVDFAPGIRAASLVAHLRHKASAQEFIVLMSHLVRGNADLRKKQAVLLVNWARSQKHPIIAVGGYNFDYDFPTRKGNEAFDAFLAEGVWKWIAPKTLIDTNWSDSNRDGKDDYPDSMLDFVFTAGAARQWNVAAEVIVREGDFPDTDQTSDHRPVRTTVSIK